MQLDISLGFKNPTSFLPFEAEVLLETQRVNGEDVSFEPVRLSGTYFVADDTVQLEGTLETVAHGACAVCLQPADEPVTLSFSETFRRNANEDEDECFRYEDKALPLDHMTLTLVMLNLPMRFSCGTSCTPAVNLKPWNEDEKTWGEEQGEGTYQPFDNLKQLLDEHESKH